MNGNYIIWNTKTGIYDGAYTNLEDAKERYIAMQDDDYWVLVQMIDGGKLANEKFHANILEEMK
jgi:hypothetical protein